MPDYRDITLTLRIGEDVMDIPQMRESNRAGYRNYIEQDVFFVDHHDVLRSAFGEYPIATTPDQIDALVEFLQTVKARMVASGA